MFKVKTTVNVPDDVIKDTLISAFEGGSNYWVEIGKSHDGDIPTNYYSDMPLQGGWFEVMDVEDSAKVNAIEKPVRVDREAIQKGLVIMADKYAKHFGDLASDNGDATTADVFLQCIVLGEVIYG